jgi:DNA mismatch repair ATPase MutS
VVHERAAAPFLRARACGHPLLAPGRMTPNDARLGGAGTLLVVSGSNMSGKTTHLRALGLNALLAYAGGPACARRLLVRRARVRTSVRVDDDLATGMSLFYAEVARLRDVVRAAEEPSAPPVLYCSTRSCTAPTPPTATRPRASCCAA